MLFIIQAKMTSMWSSESCIVCFLLWEWSTVGCDHSKDRSASFLSQHRSGRWLCVIICEYNWCHNQTETNWELFAHTLIHVWLAWHVNPDVEHNGGFTSWWTWISFEVNRFSFEIGSNLKIGCESYCWSVYTQALLHFSLKL